MRLLEGPQRWPIGDVDARELERPDAVVAAPSVKCGAMVGKCKHLSLKERLESGAGRLHMRLGVGRFSVRPQRVGETPTNFRIAARNRWNE
jgi:hypothetical protein